MNKQVILSILRDLHASGRLGGENITVDGTPLEDQDSQYRPDGWSKATTEYGARSHEAIDALHAELIEGDWAAKEAAGRMTRFFAFHPDDDPHNLLPDDPEKVSMIRWSYNEAWAESFYVFWGAKPDRVFTTDFKVKLKDPNEAMNLRFSVVDNHKTVMDPDGDYEGTPEQFVSQYVDQINRLVKRIRSGERDNPPG